MSAVSGAASGCVVGSIAVYSVAQALQRIVAHRPDVRTSPSVEHIGQRASRRPPGTPGNIGVIGMGGGNGASSTGGSIA